MSRFQSLAKNTQFGLQQQQDQHVEQITQIAQHLKYQGHEINRQLQKQRGYAQQLDNQFDLTSNKLTSVQRKLGQLLQTNDAGQICTCIMMAVLTLIFALCLILI